MTETPHEPVPAVAVSPDDHSSDRAQSDANQALNAASLETLHADLAVLVEASTYIGKAATSISTDTAAELRAATAQRSRFMKVMGLLAAITVVLLVGLMLIGVQSIGARNELRDCVTPGGKCFKDGQARTGQAVLNITQVTVAAAVCAPSYVRLPIPARQKAIQACILARLPRSH